MTTPKKAYVWYDPEADLLDIVFEIKEGFFEPTKHDRIAVKLDEDGNLLGFQIDGISHIKGQPFEIELKSKNQKTLHNSKP